MEKVEAFILGNEEELNFKDFMKEELKFESISVEFPTDTLNPMKWEPHKCNLNPPCPGEKFRFGKCLMTIYTISKDKLERNLTGQDLDWIIEAAKAGSMANCEIDYDKTTDNQLFLKFEA